MKKIKIIVTTERLNDVLAEATEAHPISVFPHPIYDNAWICECDESDEISGYELYQS